MRRTSVPQSQPNGDERNVVLGRGKKQSGQQLVTQMVEVLAGEVGEVGLPPGRAVVNVAPAAFDQPGGVEEHDRTVVEDDLVPMASCHQVDAAQRVGVAGERLHPSVGGED